MSKVLWQIPFKSFNGLSCRIDVYDPTVPEEAPISPMTYQGAEDPFYFEEDNSSDLLNDVLRYQTGYIRMIDNGGQYVKDIYPEDTFDRPVKVWYGETLVFAGYIQVQDFSTEMVPTPKMIELPVISALGLMEERTLSQTNFPFPRKVTLGELLDMVLIGGNYERVYFPNIEHTEMSQEVFSLAVCPWNKDYHCSNTNGYSYYNIYAPETHAFVIEAICKAFGWICHDTPTALVFTSFDYQDSYIYYPKGHIGDNNYKVTDTTPVAAIDLEDYFENADAQGQQNSIMPDTGIEIGYEGKSGGETFSFQRTYFYSVVSMDNPPEGEGRSLCNLLPVPNVGEISSMTPFTIDANENVSDGQCVVAWNGYEGILIAHNWLHNNGFTFFTLRFYTKRRSGQYWKVSYDLLSASDGVLSKLTKDDALKEHFRMSIDTTNDDYVEIDFNYFVTGSVTRLDSNYLVLITNIKLEVFEDHEPYAEYKYAPATESDFIRVVSNAPISASVTMPLSLYRLNTNQIGSTVLSTKITEYPYLFQKRTELVQRFRLTTAPALPHTRLFNYQNKKWRIIAQEFHPWNDEYKLTMQHSPVLTDLPSNE